jgi:hypothetical protein
VELTDIQFTNRSIPAGVDEQIDVSTLTFQLPIWINPPAKVKRQSIIHEIHSNIITDFGGNALSEIGYDEDIADFFRSFDIQSRLIVSPGNYKVSVLNNTVTLFDSAGINEQNWTPLLEMYDKELKDNTSILKLKNTNNMEDDSQDLAGTIAKNPSNDAQLIFNLDTDTLPASTIGNINKIIDPQKNVPGDGTLDNLTIGQRYLITEDLSSSGYPEWNINASVNDVIEFDGSKWSVSYDASANSDSTAITKNLNTTKVYKWNGKTWLSIYEGEYNPGYWTLVL